MSIIKIHLYRQQSTKQQKYLLTYIPEIHQTIASFLQFAINALHIDICQIDNLVVENDGYTIPQCLDAKILQKINSLTIKVKNISNENKKKPTKITELVTLPKINNDMRHLQQQSLNLRERMDQEILSDSSTPKFSQDGIAKNKTQIITQKIPTKKQTNKLLQKQKIKKVQTKKSKKPQIPQPQSQQSEQSLQQKKPIKKLQLKKGKKMESFKKQSSSQESSVSQKEESQSGNESSSQSSQSSEEELPRVIRTKKAQLKSKIHEKQLQKYNKLNTQPKEKQSVENDRKKNLLLQRFTKAQKPLEQRRQLSICVKKAQVKTVNNNTTKPEIQRSTKHNKPQVQQQLKQNKAVKPFPVTYANRKKLIQADDIESSNNSSSSSSQQQQVIKKVVNARGQNISKQQKLSQQEYQKQSIPMVNTNNKNYSNNKSKMLPPSLRNKPYQQKQQQQSKHHQNKQSDRQQNKPLQPSAFKQHQQQQWLPVTKQLIATYKQSLIGITQQNKQLPFLKPNNLIRFRQIQLDQQRFVPKESQWIEGTVSKVQNDQKIVLNKVTQLGKQFRMRYDTYEHNMVVLQVNRNYLTEEQRLAILPKENNNTTNQANQFNVVSQQQQSLGTEQKGIEKTQDIQKEQQKPTQDKTSIEKFICGQVNFYFSDKNYPFDLFMQMHANKHPQKYIPIRFLLNFPKIKKILKDEHKLLKYLVEDEKRNERNFQIDEQRKLVRKRVAKINQGQQSQGKMEEQQKAEHQNENGQNDAPQNQ